MPKPKLPGHQYRDGIQRITDSTGNVVGYRVQIRRRGFPLITKRFRRLDAARAWRGRMIPDIEQHLVDPGALAKRYTVADAIDEYLKGDATKLKPSTRKAVGNRLAWWRSRIGTVPLVDLSKLMLSEVLAQLNTTGSTKNRYQSNLSSALAVACNREWHTRNVARELKRQKEGRRRERVITAAEWMAVQEAAIARATAPGASRLTRQLPNYLALLYATGMRAGEALSLQWSNVDLAAGRVRLLDTKNSIPRTVVLDMDGRAALEAQVAFRREGWPWVFIGRSPLAHAARFNNSFNEIRKVVGIKRDSRGEPLVIHSLRHSFATELAAGGADLFELMSATGHKSIVAAQRYIKTDEEQSIRAISKRRRPKLPATDNTVVSLHGKGKRHGTG